MAWWHPRRLRPCGCTCWAAAAGRSPPPRGGSWRAGSRCTPGPQAPSSCAGKISPWRHRTALTQIGGAATTVWRDCVSAAAGRFSPSLGPGLLGRPLPRGSSSVSRRPSELRGDRGDPDHSAGLWHRPPPAAASPSAAPPDTPAEPPQRRWPGWAPLPPHWSHPGEGWGPGGGRTTTRAWREREREEETEREGLFCSEGAEESSDSVSSIMAAGKPRPPPLKHIKGSKVDDSITVKELQTPEPWACFIDLINTGYW